MSAPDLRDHLAQGRRLSFAPDEGRVPALKAAQATGLRLQANNSKGRHRFALALDFNTAKVFAVKPRRDESISIVCDLHCARLSSLLHASRQVNGVSHRRILYSQIRANLAYYDKARIEADAHVQVQPALALKLFA